MEDGLLSKEDGETLDAIQKAQDAEQLAQAAIEHLLITVEAAGRKLAEKKQQLDYGAWSPWIKANLKISEEVVRRWMKLAKHVDMHGWDSLMLAKNITEAYRLVGALPMPDPSPGKPATSEGCFAFLNKMETRIEETLGQIQPDEREQLCTRLRRLLNRLETVAPA